MHSIPNGADANDAGGEAGEEQLRTYADRAGITFEILIPARLMPTVALAAEAIGVDESSIIKSVLFTSSDGSAVLAITAGTARIDRERLAHVAGMGRLRLASPEAVLRLTGYPAGGVAPIGHVTKVPVVIDSRVLLLDAVYGGGGSKKTLLKIAPHDIVRLTGATIAEIRQTN